MSNADKHRILTPTFYGVDQADSGIKLEVVDGAGVIEDFFVWPDALRANAEVVTVTWRPEDANAKVVMKAGPKAYVAFENGRRVKADLHGIAELVAAILREFEPFFPQPPHGDPYAEWVARDWVPESRSIAARWFGIRRNRYPQGRLP